MTKKINWDASTEEFQAIRKIVARALKINKELDRTELTMDLTATHLNGMPLKLNDMADPKIVDDFNLMHDIYGISAHINRKTAQIDGFFLPRCAA